MQPEPDLDAGYFSDEASTFGDRVAAGRRALGIDQERLSRKLGIKLKTLRAWEEDASEPRANKLQMLAGVLNVSIIWLLTGEGEGVDDPWEREEQEGLESCAAEVGEILSDLRILRTAHTGLADRMARLEKKLSKLLKKIG
ncbi:MAG: helix-turn-helix domain-containing protein [Alphaproteobacteria bacterium]|nr:helix-turn-helix domain-containing protein [Alphaproteobacteria bacterium]